MGRAGLTATRVEADRIAPLRHAFMAGPGTRLAVTPSTSAVAALCGRRWWQGEPVGYGVVMDGAAAAGARDALFELHPGRSTGPTP